MRVLFVSSSLLKTLFFISMTLNWPCMCLQPCMFPYFQPPSHLPFKNWLWLFLNLKSLTKVAMTRNLKATSTSNFQLSKIKTNPVFNFRHCNRIFTKTDHRPAKGLKHNLLQPVLIQFLLNLFIFIAWLCSCITHNNKPEIGTYTISSN